MYIENGLELSPDGGIPGGGTAVEGNTVAVTAGVTDAVATDVAPSVGGGMVIEEPIAPEALAGS